MALDYLLEAVKDAWRNHGDLATVEAILAEPEEMPDIRLSEEAMSLLRRHVESGGTLGYDKSDRPAYARLRGAELMTFSYASNWDMSEARRMATSYTAFAGSDAIYRLTDLGWRFALAQGMVPSPALRADLTPSTRE